MQGYSLEYCLWRERIAKNERNIMKFTSEYHLRSHTHTTHDILFKDNPATYIYLHNIHIHKHTYVCISVSTYLNQTC